VVEVVVDVVASTTTADLGEVDNLGGFVVFF